jgi:hypothetical protein
MKKKFDIKSCNVRDVDFQLFNIFKLNKYQKKDTNKIDLSDTRLSNDLGKSAVRPPPPFYFKLFTILIKISISVFIELLLDVTKSCKFLSDTHRCHLIHMLYI